MENKLEQLLNTLIQRGWKPRGDKNWENNTRITNIYFRQDENGKLPYIRMIVSKESGIWQFVCENKLYNPDNRGYWGKNVTIVGEYPTLDGDENIGYREYEYYLIESSLKDEPELESFILDNIKV